MLSKYENSLSDYLGIRSRHIVDKFEPGLEVDNIDLFDLPSEQKYHSIVSLSTVEHIGQGISPTGEFGESNQQNDLEAPLKAIAKIYDLLHNEGKALITVPFGKLTNGGWYIQFSSEYLKLLVTKFGVPKESLSVSFLRRTEIELGSSENNPYQLWVEAEEKDLSNVEYNLSWNGASAIAIIELTKLSDRFILDSNATTTSLDFGFPILIGTIYYDALITLAANPDANGEILSENCGFVFHGFYNRIPVGEYELNFSIQVDVPCELLFEFLIKGNNERILQSRITHSSDIHWSIIIGPELSNIEFRLSNCSGRKVKVYAKKFIFRRANYVVS